jgi:8-oxo-dGTP pyrophosphatase MutT (NUDIX family)
MPPTATDPAVVLPIQECIEAYVLAGEPRQVLLLKRTEERGGFWQPVSGRIEPFDPDPPAAVRREVLEETGFSPERPPVDLSWSFAFPGRDGRTWRVHAYGLSLPATRPPRLSGEHTAFQWVPLGQAAGWLAFEDNREALRRAGWLVPW